MTQVQDFLRRLTIGMVGWFFAFFAFTFLVDPYGISPVRVSLSSFNEHKPKRIDIDRQIKPIEVWRYQPKTVFLGTSRIHQSIDPRSLAATPLAPAYNGSVPAMSLGMNIAFLERYVELNPKLQNVFAELFLYNFLGQGQDWTALGQREILRDAASLLASSDTLWDSIITLLANSSGRRRSFEIASEGYLKYPEEHNAGSFFSTFSNGIWQIQPPPGESLTLHEQSFRALDEISETAKRRGLELAFIATPNHAYFDYFIDFIDGWPLIEKWLLRAVETKTVYSFAQPNAWTQEKVGQSMRYWNDPFHFTSSMGRAMASALAGQSVADAPSNFMIRLTPDRVSQHVAERREAVRAWARGEPEFVERFLDAHYKWLRKHGLPVPVADPVIVIGKQTNESLVLDGRSIPVVDRTVGVLERAEEGGRLFEIQGWVTDFDRSIEGGAIVAAIDGDIVARTTPTIPRPDVRLRGAGDLKASEFQLRMPLPNPDSAPARTVRVFALCSDGKAVQLASSLHPGRVLRIEQRQFRFKDLQARSQ